MFFSFAYLALPALLGLLVRSQRGPGHQRHRSDGPASRARPRRRISPRVDRGGAASGCGVSAERTEGLPDHLVVFPSLGAPHRATPRSIAAFWASGICSRDRGIRERPPWGYPRPRSCWETEPSCWGACRGLPASRWLRLGPGLLGSDPRDASRRREDAGVPVLPPDADARRIFLEHLLDHSCPARL